MLPQPRSKTGAMLQIRGNRIGGVNSVAFLPDNKQIAAEYDNETIQLWDTKNKVIKISVIPGLLVTPVHPSLKIYSEIANQFAASRKSMCRSYFRHSFPRIVRQRHPVVISSRKSFPCN